MPDHSYIPQQKAYVKVAAFEVAEPFDPKYAASLPELMLKVAETAIDKSRRLSTTPCADQRAQAFYLDGELTSLKKTAQGAETLLSAEIRIDLAEWPQRSTFASARASARLPAGDASNLDGDVEYLVQDLVKSVMADKVIKAFEKRL
jgi:hypothetical protein